MYEIEALIEVLVRKVSLAIRVTLEYPLCIWIFNTEAAERRISWLSLVQKT
jgi:hypothetical protein